MKNRKKHNYFLLLLSVKCDHHIYSVYRNRCGDRIYNQRFSFAYNI